MPATSRAPTRHVTRRALFAGLAAAAGSVIGRSPRVRQPQPVVIRRGTLASDHWPGRRPRWVVVGSNPPGPLVIALHSLGTNANWFVNTLDAGQVALRTGLTIAAIDGGTTYWHPHRNGVNTAAMVTNDFLPMLARMGLNTQRLGLTGISMGGYGVMRLATEMPQEQVAGIAVVAPALRRTYWENRTLLFDDKASFDANNPFARLDALRGIPVGIVCGKQDDFYPASAAMARLLPARTALFNDGWHSTRYMAAHWGPLMSWLAFEMGVAPLAPA